MTEITISWDKTVDQNATEYFEKAKQARKKVKRIKEIAEDTVIIENPKSFERGEIMEFRLPYVNEIREIKIIPKVADKLCSDKAVIARDIPNCV